MKFRSCSAFVALVLSCLALVDCGGGGEPHESPEECETIASLCHAAADIDDAAADCHDQAHEGDLELCLEIEDECLALCEDILGMGGAGGLGGSTGH